MKLSNYPGELALKNFLKDAHIPSLLGTLAHLTNDLTLLREEFRPNYLETAAGFQPHGGLSLHAQEKARDLAFSVIKQLYDGDLEPQPPLDKKVIRKIMEYMIGLFCDDHFSLLLNELGLTEYLQLPQWNKSTLAPDREFKVAIIGAGLSGLGIAYRLKQVGIPFVILERNPQVGGVWSENFYPGCHLDTSNFNYSYSFNQNPHWKEEFASRDAILDYLKSCVDKFELHDQIRLNTEVLGGEYKEDEGNWILTLKNADG